MTKEDAMLIIQRLALNTGVWTVQSGLFMGLWNVGVAPVLNTRKINYQEALSLTALLALVKWLGDDVDFYLLPPEPDDYDDVLKQR
jgi:hypothetical protein